MRQGSAPGDGRAHGVPHCRDVVSFRHGARPPAGSTRRREAAKMAAEGWKMAAVADVQSGRRGAGGPLVLAGDGRAALRRFQAALRVGRPVCWMSREPPDGWTPDELGPLVLSTGCVAARRWRRPAEAGSGPGVTVVMPSHRRAPWGLAALRRQSWDTRVLVLDNGVPEDVLMGSVRRISVPWQGHADTRRHALAHVDTPLLLFMSDDAVPLGSGFVGTLARALIDHPGRDAVVARQVPWPLSHPTTRAAIRRWTPARSGLMPHADHVATMYRTDQLRQWLRDRALHGWPIAEDLVWTRGRQVWLEAHAPVLHAHPRRPAALFSRRFAEHRVRMMMGEDAPVDGVLAMMTAAPFAVSAGLRHGPLEVACGLAELAGMALGARAGRSG